MNVKIIDTEKGEITYKDIGMKYPTIYSKKPNRYGLFNCPSCNKEKEHVIRDIKRWKFVPLCNSCKIEITESKKHSFITYERLIELLEYLPDLGYFIYKEDSKKGKKGEKAGYYSQIHKRNFIQIDYKEYYVSDLAYLYMNKHFPKNKIDHIDNNSSNDVWNNLRHCTSAENNWNRRLSSLNKTGIKGVSYCNTYNKYVAKITKHGKTIMKRFKTKELAENWIKGQRQQLHGEFANHGY